MRQRSFAAGSGTYIEFEFFGVAIARICVEFSVFDSISVEQMLSVLSLIQCWSFPAGKQVTTHALLRGTTSVNALRFSDDCMFFIVHTATI